MLENYVNFYHLFLFQPKNQDIILRKKVILNQQKQQIPKINRQNKSYQKARNKGNSFFD